VSPDAPKLTRMGADPATNGELQSPPVVSGPVRVLEPRTRFLPATRPPAALTVTAGGLLAAAAVATLRRARRRSKRLRGGRRRELVGGRVVASRSFLVDVRLLDR